MTIEVQKLYNGQQIVVGNNNNVMLPSNFDSKISSANLRKEMIGKSVKHDRNNVCSTHELSREKKKQKKIRWKDEVNTSKRKVPKVTKVNEDIIVQSTEVTLPLAPTVR